MLSQIVEPLTGKQRPESEGGKSSGLVAPDIGNSWAKATPIIQPVLTVRFREINVGHTAGVRSAAMQGGC